MKRKLLKTMACAMSVCMLSVSLAGCGNDASQGSDAGSSTPESSTSESSASDAGDSGESGDEAQGGVEDRSDGLFPAYDFGGVELTVLAHNDLGGLDPDAEGLEDDKIAERQDKKDYIEAKYNVKLTFVPLPTSDWDEINNQIVADFRAGSPTADIMDVYYQHMATYVSNNVLYDFTSKLESSPQFDKESYFYWQSKAWGISSGIGGEGFFYNKEWIENMGMEYTPAEMFDMGLWDYDHFLQYLRDMKALMAEDEYPLYVDPYYWCLFAMAANGEIILDPSGELNYLSDAFIETFTLLETIFNEGLLANPVTYAADGTIEKYNAWGYPGDTFDKGQTVAMAHRASWQAAYINDPDYKFELGFVPYPWGSNVSIGHTGDPGDYLTLSDNYKASYFDGQLLCMTDGIQEKADPVQVLSMLLEWMGWKSKMVDYVSEEPAKADYMEDGLDKDLWRFSLSRERLEPYNSLDIELQFMPYDMIYLRQSVRSMLESYYNQDMNLMIDAGFATADVFHEVEVEGEAGTEGEGDTEAGTEGEGDTEADTEGEGDTEGE